jgi:hypothetical protein
MKNSNLKTEDQDAKIKKDEQKAVEAAKSADDLKKKGYEMFAEAFRKADDKIARLNE